MSETELKEPIIHQKQLDEIVKTRLARDRAKLEGEYKQALEEKDAEIARLQQQHEEELSATKAQAEAEIASAKEQAESVRKSWTDERRQAAIEQFLIERGHTDANKNQRILRYLNLDDVAVDEDGQPNSVSVAKALSQVQEDLPELFSEGNPLQLGAGSRGSDKPLDRPLTREEIEKLSPEEIKETPGLMERVDQFLSRGR
jgi:hypothetical protein